MFVLNLILFIKGILIGMFMLVPGISGGTLAIILGIYDRLLSSLSHLFKDFKKNFLYLFTVMFAGLIGLFISSFVLDFFVRNFYFELIFTFIGIMILYIFNTFKKTNIKIYQRLLYIFIGVLIGYLITCIPVGIFSGRDNIIFLLFLGIFLAIALILPGVSVSYVLLVFGLYDYVILAIKNFDLMYLFKLGVFLIIGLLVVAKGLSYMLFRKKDMTDFIISGFVISSIITVIPSVRNYSELVYAMIFILIGFFINSLINIKK